MCIDIVEIGLGLLMGKFRQFLKVIFCPPHDSGRGIIIIVSHFYYSPLSPHLQTVCVWSGWGGEGGGVEGDRTMLVKQTVL